MSDDGSEATDLAPQLPVPDGPPRPTPSMPAGPPLPSGAPTAAHPHPPRPGDLTVGWRTITAVTWIGVVIAFAAVWNTSVQLGLSTWWLGPRSDPQPRVVQFAPFIVPVVMVLAAINQIRWLPRYGMLASLVVIAIGVGDIDRITRLALVEIAVGIVAFAVSAAAITGTYRADPTRVGPWPAPSTDRPTA